MKRLGLIGAGELGETIVAQLADGHGLEPVAFFDDVAKVEQRAGVPVVGGIDDVVASHQKGMFDEVVISVGYNHLGFRQALFNQLQAEGIRFATLVHPTCNVSASAQIGPGSILFPGCTLDAGVEIGPNSLVNTGCVVAHDSRVLGHTFLGPGVTLAGRVTVAERCFLGVGTTVIDHVSIGEGAQTGGGAVVVRDVEARTLVVGVPARKLRSLKKG